MTQYKVAACHYKFAEHRYKLAEHRYKLVEHLGRLVACHCKVVSPKKRIAEHCRELAAMLCNSFFYRGLIYLVEKSFDLSRVAQFVTAEKREPFVRG